MDRIKKYLRLKTAGMIWRQQDGEIQESSPVYAVRANPLHRSVNNWKRNTWEEWDQLGAEWEAGEPNSVWICCKNMSHNPWGEIQWTLIKGAEGEIGESAVRGRKVPGMKEGSIMPSTAQGCSQISAGKLFIGSGDFACVRQFQWTTRCEIQTTRGCRVMKMRQQQI